MKLVIKNMYDKDSKEWLVTVLRDLEILHEKEISLGELSLQSAISQQKFQELKMRLEDKGLAVISDRRQILTEQIKYVVLDMLAQPERPMENYSHFIAKKMLHNYSYLANVFSQTEGITIEHFIINQKLEKAKELLLGSDHSIGQVADLLGYSSVGHFSNQFKKVLGITPTEFKKHQFNKIV